MLVRLALIIFSFAITACAGGMESSLPSLNASSEGLLPPEITGNVSIAKSTDTLVSELAMAQKVQLEILAAENLGSVQLRVAKPEIDALDPRQGVKFVVSPSAFELRAGQTVLVELTLDVQSTAPSLTNQHVHLELVRAVGNALLAETELRVTVQPVFRVKVFGAGDANWMVNGRAISSLFNSTSGARGIDFIHHPTGLAVIFENHQAGEMTIHSSGAISHGTPVAVGASYTPTPVVGSAVESSGVWLHGQEGSDVVRRLVFNTNR